MKEKEAEVKEVKEVKEVREGKEKEVNGAKDKDEEVKKPTKVVDAPPRKMAESKTSKEKIELNHDKDVKEVKKSTKVTESLPKKTVESKTSKEKIDPNQSTANQIEITQLKDELDKKDGQISDLGDSILELRTQCDKQETEIIEIK